jgi:hypothetical protein
MNCWALSTAKLRRLAKNLTLTLLGQGEHAGPDRPERLKLLEEAVDTARHALAPSHSARRTAEDALRPAQPASVPQPASVR